MAEIGGASWVTIVAAPEAYTESNNPLSVVGTLTTAINSGYFNSYQWTKTTWGYAEPYISFTFTEEQIASLSGKSTMAISFKIGSNNTYLKEVAVGLFNGDVKIGECKTELTSKAGAFTRENCTIDFTDTSNLNLKIETVNPTTETSGLGLRIYPITIEAK